MPCENSREYESVPLAASAEDGSRGGRGSGARKALTLWTLGLARRSRRAKDTGIEPLAPNQLAFGKRDEVVYLKFNANRQPPRARVSAIPTSGNLADFVVDAVGLANEI
jgi:hypothetical protein